MSKNEIKEVYRYLKRDYGKQLALEYLIGMLYREVASGNMTQDESDQIYKELEG